MKHSISQLIEKRTAYIGFTIYVLLVFAIPFIFITIGRIADHELMHNYIVPFSEYKFLLIVISGLLTGMVSINSPFVNSIYVGLLGLLVWLIFSGISTSIAGVDFSYKLITYQCVERVALCAAGGLCVTLFRQVAGKIQGDGGI